MTAVKWLEEQIIKEGNYKQKKMLMELFEQAKQIEKEYIEISDDEIEKSMRRYNITDFGQMAAYITGVKWYREKLKNKNE